MRRVLVPLDGSPLAETILPDARRLAGPTGELVLVRDVGGSRRLGSSADDSAGDGVDAVRAYLERIGDALRADGASVRTRVVTLTDAAVAIDASAETLQADMIAAATHGWNPAQRWHRGGVAWRALVRSTVPVLLRHVDESSPSLVDPTQRRVLVPLDGSSLAEKALPLASQLAEEWAAPLYLTEVVPDPLNSEMPSPNAVGREKDAAEYLRDLVGRVPGATRASLLEGPVVEALVRGVEEWSITDIVMTSHGRSGLSRAIVGSVADELIHRLRRCIIVIPPLVTLDEDTHETALEEGAGTA